MKRTSAELKRLAREVLRGNYGLPMGALVVTILIVTVILLPFSFVLSLSYYNVLNIVIFYIVAFLIGILGFVLQLGISYMHLGLVRKRQISFIDLFYAFTIRPDRFILGYLILFLIGFVSMIPGIFFMMIGDITYSTLLMLLAVLFYIAACVVIVIISLRFTLVFLLMLDHPDMKVIQAFRESTRLMDGHKGRYFYIQLSFIGWSILGALSCYIGYLWIIPYMNQTTVNFYLDVIGELDKLGNTSNDVNGNNYTVQNTTAYNNTIKELLKDNDPAQDTLPDSNTDTASNTITDNNNAQDTLPVADTAPDGNNAQDTSPITDTPQNSYNNDSDLI